ncbi:MAG: FliH/SctL family protein [Rhodospirillales bacterium]
MATVRKFTFDLDFDAPEEPETPEIEEVEEEEPEIIVPTFSEEELEQARAESFEAGKEEGRKEAAGTTEQRLLEAIESAVGQLNSLYSAQREANHEIGREMIAVSTAIAKKMFPDLNARNALGEVERVVQETLKAITEEPRIQIMVNPELREPLTERLGTMTHRAGFEGKVFVNPDPTMPLGDCRIEWSNGAAVRDADTLWEMIEGIIEHNLHGPEDGEDMDAEAEAAEDTDAEAAAAPEQTDDAAPETPVETDDVAENEVETDDPVSDPVDESPSWETEIGESTEANTQATSDMPPADDAEDDDTTFPEPVEDTDDGLDEPTFAPAIDPDDDRPDAENSQSDQEVNEFESGLPIPSADILDSARQEPDGEQDEQPAAAAPVSGADPLSPATATAILDAQSSMNDEDDRDPSGQ